MTIFYRCDSCGNEMAITKRPAGWGASWDHGNWIHTCSDCRGDGIATELTARVRVKRDRSPDVDPDQEEMF